MLRYIGFATDGLPNRSYNRLLELGLPNYCRTRDEPTPLFYGGRQTDCPKLIAVRNSSPTGRERLI
jgi:hypothetical protein